jgi:hypothetical protein
MKDLRYVTPEETRDIAVKALLELGAEDIRLVILDLPKELHDFVAEVCAEGRDELHSERQNRELRELLRRALNVLAAWEKGNDGEDDETLGANIVAALLSKG